jgi:hypothetical protein
MWERKTPEEIRRIDDRLRFSPINSLGCALLIATLSTIAASWGYWGNDSPAHQPQSHEELIQWFTFNFVMAFLVMYFLQSVGKSSNGSAMICDRCKQVTDCTTDTQCPCGGQRESLTHWTWVPHVSDYK